MIRPEEIDYIEEIGELNNSPVQLIRTKGGFWVAAGKANFAGKDEALSAGSHPAIVKFNLQKKFGNKYQEVMNKSESTLQPFVIDGTHHLNKKLYNLGYSLHSVIAGPEISVILSRQNNEIARVEGLVKTESIDTSAGFIFSNIEKSKEAEENGIAKSLIFALSEVTKKLNKKDLNYNTSAQKIDVSKINGKK